MTAVLPRTLALGGGSIKQLGNVLRQHGITKPLVVTDKPLVALGVVDRVVRELGAPCEVYDDTVPDPTSDTCDALAARLAFGDFDGVVAVGGGSPMDTAKAACVLRDLGGRMRDDAAGRWRCHDDARARFTASSRRRRVAPPLPAALAAHDRRKTRA